MLKFTSRAAQGEISITKLEGRVDMTGFSPVSAKGGRLVVSHSESGNDHFLPDDGSVTLLERVGGTASGMAVLLAIVRSPTALQQSAAVPHQAIHLAPGTYEMRLAREFDPFSEMARRVAD